MPRRPTPKPKRFSAKTEIEFRARLQQALDAMDNLTTMLNENEGILDENLPSDKIIMHSEIALAAALDQARALTQRALLVKNLADKPQNP